MPDVEQLRRDILLKERELKNMKKELEELELMKINLSKAYQDRYAYVLVYNDGFDAFEIPCSDIISTTPQRIVEKAKREAAHYTNRTLYIAAFQPVKIMGKIKV